MIVNLIAPMLTDEVLRQKQSLISSGYDCQLYIQEQGADQGQPEGQEDLSAFLGSEQGQECTLFLFHYIGQPYALLEGMSQIRHSTVVLDLSASAIFDQAPAHYADFCLVATPVQKQALHSLAGFTLERTYVVSGQENYAECFGEVLDRVRQGLPARTDESPAKSGQSFGEDEVASLFVLRDPTLDAKALLSDVAESCRHRWGEGGDDLDMTTIGPEALRSLDGEIETPQKADIEELLWSFRLALDDLASHACLVEPEFFSSVPVFGPFIVAVRRFWNTISTKWYVIGWMNQQGKFNAAAVDLVYALLKLQEHNEQRLCRLESELESALTEEKKGHVA